MSGRHWLALALYVPFLTGCLIPKESLKPPVLPVPAQYKNASLPAAVPLAPSPAAPLAGEAQAATEVPLEWWRYFGNAELRALIDRGLSNNPDIRISLNRIVQAKARADQASGATLPSISAPMVVAEQYPGGTTVGTAPVGSDSASGSTGSSGGSRAQRSYQASIRADWRLDIWGEQSSLADSARFQLQRAVFERENVQRNLAASIAGSYVEYLSLNDRLKIARKTEELLSATLATIEKRVEVGDATLSELEQQRASIFSVRASVPMMEQQRVDAIGSMAFLVGTVPGDLKLSDDGLDSLSIPRVVPGLPSALLLRRPDVRMAEAQLMGANADVSVARARLLPAIDLSTQYGYSAILLSTLFSPQALFWNVVGSSTVSIFDGGRKQNDKVFSQAVQEEMVESYVRALHQAMKEVEGALSSVRLADRRLSAQQETIQAARRAWDISSKVYGAGGIDYLTLLDTERSYHRYMDDYQHTRMDYFRSYITLFQALGGGVNPEKTLRPPPTAPAVFGRSPARQSVEGIGLEEAMGSSPETFWQVELAGLYHRASVGPAWRDLRIRYPGYMEGRSIRPRLKGRIEESDDEPQSWYRLQVVKFPTPGEAEQFCQALKADQQRCRVVSSLSDETVLATATPKIAPAPASAAGQVSLADKPKPSAIARETTFDKLASPPAAVAKVSTGPMAAPPAALAPVAVAPVNQLPLVTAAASARGPAAVSTMTALLPASPSAKLIPASAHVSSVPAVSVPSVGQSTRAGKGRSKTYTLQFGAYSSMENAKVAADSWRAKGYDARPAETQDVFEQHWYVVRSGSYARKPDASAAARAVRSKEGVSVLVAAVTGEPMATPSPAGMGTAPSVKQVAVVSARQPLLFTVQLAAYAGEENAERAAALLQLKGVPAYVAHFRDRRNLASYVVRAGSFRRRVDGLALIRSLDQRERSKARLMRASTAADEPSPVRTPTQQGMS